MEPALSVRGLSAAYDGAPVVFDVDLDVPTGVLMAIIGPNGAGKSSLLKAVMGALDPLAGRVLVFGRPIHEQWARVAYIPQRSTIDWDFPTTVLDLVMMGTYGRLGWFRRPGARQKQEALEALRVVEMENFAERQIGELSGGQQQRIFFARALVQNADLYLMDEPFAGLDATTERAIVELLHGLRAEGKTMVVVHHDLTTVSEYFDQVALLNRELITHGPVPTNFVTPHIENTYGGPVHGLRKSQEPRRESRRNKHADV